ncbi:conserved Plasmodium protein, unknown function [Plasmodium gallinaceum]|uniref:Uncharacterized protein n=1 Tax=Plasmodium gallinaceum TaxID=5849 RepID=A0A1J1GZ92_PLAGA|nr:conserved Plasmodium protein, unknown function [Plasmodium gallinaceum]CRG97781.1 conserved Plasmodium protein, unknown function [Plasmodium gallinaceum]
MLYIPSFITIIIYLALKNNLGILANKNKSINPVYILLKESKKNYKIGNTKKNTIINLFIYNIKEKKIRKNKIYLIKKNVNKKRKIGKIFATGNFFNPKQFKDIFSDEDKKIKKKDNDECLELEKIENLKEICPELYKKLNDYNRSEESEDELKYNKEEEEEIVDIKNISVYEGLPLLMVDGKDFQGFADSRKIKIKPDIATEFTNSDYNEFINSNSNKKNINNNKNGEINEKKLENDEMDKLKEKNNNIENKNDDCNDFEKKVQYILDEKKKNQSEDNNEKEIKSYIKEENLTKQGKIEKYKKVGKHYYMDSELGEVLFDRNYPGYIYLNHGENIKDLDEKSEFDSEFPSYINPSNVHLRTGRKREEQKKKDSGIKQKKRWNLKVENDIKRGNWKYYDDTVKDLLDSIDQEKLSENYYSNNYYQRTNYNTGYGNLEKVQNNYFDVQFIGSAETYPSNVSVGMNFIWPINFIPLLCKQYTKRLGQPIKSEIFNLGGFDSLQIWFYPDGMNNSIDGYCSLKLVMKPGSYLPVKIFFFAFSEYNYVHTKPFYKESADYVASSLNLCKLLLKTKENLKKVENNKDYVILGPAGNIYIGVGIYDDVYDFDEDFKKFYTINDKYKKKKEKEKHKFKYKYDWDEGVHIFDNWLKKQTAITDDKNELLPVYYTHSDLYENYKYKYVPEKNPFKFLNKKKDNQKWNRHPF